MFKKRRYPYRARILLSGKHPYRTESEFSFPDRRVNVTVDAKDWNEAAKLALKNIDIFHDWWSAKVYRIEKL